MAASLLIEEESGTYTARIRHPHNGYYAGDFSQTPRPGPRLHVFHAGRRDRIRPRRRTGSFSGRAAGAPGSGGT
jgi:hypothetical protein